MQLLSTLVAILHTYSLLLIGEVTLHSNHILFSEKCFYEYCNITVTVTLMLKYSSDSLPKISKMYGGGAVTQQWS